MGEAMETIRYGSVCSGIEAATVAWESLGWNAAWFAEIEPFPSAVLAHHYPEIANHGDMTKLAKKVLTGEIEAPDVLVGGPPCQAFSIAGMREGLNDPRGQLTIKYVELADAIDYVRTRRGLQPAIAVWENVPGVLSDKGNAFGCFLGALSGEDCELQPPRGKWTNAGCLFGPKRTVVWRILDAQYFGLAQRRRRVFVVASARKDIHPAQILFEFEGMRRDSAPSREARQTAPTIPARSTAGGGLGTDFDCDGGVITMAHGQGGAEIGFDRGPCLTCNHEAPIAVIPSTTHTLRGEGFDASEDGTGRGQPIVAAYSVALRGREGGATAELGDDLAGSLRASSGGGDKPHVLAPVVTHAIQAGALRTNPMSGPGCVGVQEGVAYTLEARAEVQCVQSMLQVRRLTVEECEFLQGFPRSYTKIPWRKKPASECPDGPRYKAIGNSMAVQCMGFIGRRIDRFIKRTSDALP